MNGTVRGVNGDHFDAIVVGAGAAGLAAGQRLSSAGLSIVIVEARDRIGGRIDTLRPAGWPVPIEAGAEFIHGESKEIWSLVHHTSLSACEIQGEQWDLAGGRLRSQDFDQLWGLVMDRLECHARDEQSFADFLNRHCSDLSPADRARVIAYVEGFNAADSRVVNSRWILDADRASGLSSPAGTFRLPDGYDGILQGLFPGNGPVPPVLRLGCLVSAVRWEQGRVEVIFQSREGQPPSLFSARRAVITVPLGVLLAGPDLPAAIRFDPDLPEKWNACRSLRMGSVVKVHLRFRTAFWEDVGLNDLGFLHGIDEPFPTWWTTHPVRSSVLTGWAGGPKGEGLSGLESDIAVQHSLESLSQILSVSTSDLNDSLQAWHVADWSADPLARGAYSYVAVGGHSASRLLAEPVADTLFFAGEATHDVLNGTVGGALASGFRAADEILHSL